MHLPAKHHQNHIMLTILIMQMMMHRPWNRQPEMQILPDSKSQQKKQADVQTNMMQLREKRENIYRAYL